MVVAGGDAEADGAIPGAQKRGTRGTHLLWEDTHFLHLPGAPILCGRTHFFFSGTGGVRLSKQLAGLN